MHLIIFKILIIILILFTALLGAYLALKTKESLKGSLYLSLGNTFAAGIFFGAGLIHMLPDAAEGFSHALKSEFPFAAFIASLGFLLILFLEKVLIVNSEPSFRNKKTKENSLSPYILLLILSIHSIIVGIALGTEERISQSFIIAIAVLAHKGSASFALVVDMLKNHMHKQEIIKYIIFFSLMTPLGILLGTLLSHLLDGNMSEISIAFFDALAAGTFLYIAIMEIFNEEFNQTQHTILKLLISTLGLLLMALLALWL